MMKKLFIPLLLILALANPAYAFAATLSLSPASGTFNKGCSLNVDIKLDTGGKDTDGTDAIVLYDTSKLTATSIDSGTIYADYPGNNIDDTSGTGKVTISGLASFSTAFKGIGTLATIHFNVKDTAAAGATIVKFDFEAGGKTTDSNVLERGTSVDILSAVSNANYTIGTGSCTAATPTPAPGGGKGAVIVVPVSTPSAQIPLKEAPPVKTLPPAGSEQFTFMIVIVGSALTVLGILGLSLL